MKSNVVKFEPVLIGASFRFDPDEMLEAAKGQGFATLLIIGELEDGTQWTSGNANVGEALILIERAKHELLFGED